MDLSPAQRHILVTAISVLSIVECFGWAGACAVGFLYRIGDPFGAAYSSDQVTHNTVLAVVVSLLLIINLLATAAFILGTRTLGLPVLAIVQVVNIVAIIVLLSIQSSSLSVSLPVSALPAVTLLALALLWRASPQDHPVQ
jgi:hypothetical protein